MSGNRTLMSLPDNMLRVIGKHLGPMNRSRLASVSKGMYNNSKRLFPAPPTRAEVITALRFLLMYARPDPYKTINARKKIWKTWGTMPKNTKRVHLISTTPTIYGPSVKFNDNFGRLRYAKENKSLNKYINIINNMSNFYRTGTNKNIRKKEIKLGIVQNKPLSYAEATKGY